MPTYRIAVVPGDGIGVDTIDQAVLTLETVCEVHGGLDLAFDRYPWGCGYYLEHGEMMPKDGLQILADYDAILLGAVGFPTVPDHVSLWGLLLPIRKTFDQYINLRPVREHRRGHGHAGAHAHSTHRHLIFHVFAAKDTITHCAWQRLITAIFLHADMFGTNSK